MKKIFSHFGTWIAILCFFGCSLIPYNLNAAIRGGRNVQSVMDVSGNVLAVWEALDTTLLIQVIQSANYIALTNKWSAPFTISPTGYDTHTPIIATNSLGNVVVLCSYTDPITGVTRLAAVTCNTLLAAWSSPQNVSNSIENLSSDYKVNTSDTGQVVATWSSFTTSYTKTRASSSLFGGSCTTPVTISN